MRAVRGVTAERLGVTFLGVVLLAGCRAAGDLESSGSAFSVTGTVSGHLYVVGGPAPGLPRPLSGTVVAEGPGGSHDVTAGADGEYTMQLPPGTYSMTGTSLQDNGGKGLCQASGKVTVVRDQARTVDVYCHIA